MDAVGKTPANAVDTKGGADDQRHRKNDNMGPAHRESLLTGTAKGRVFAAAITVRVRDSRPLHRAASRGVGDLAIGLTGADRSTQLSLQSPM